MFYVLMVMMAIGVHTFVKTHQTMCFKWVFILCKLYINKDDSLKNKNTTSYPKHAQDSY